MRELALVRLDSKYVVAYSPSHRGPNWAAWDLNRGYFGGAARHAGHSITDESLPAGFPRVTHADYTGSGYDRGHMARSEDRARSNEDNASTFLLTNVLPQRHDLNTGLWLHLEDACRTLAQHDGRELYIAAGPIYDPQPATIGHGVAVPVAFWKVVVVLAPDQGAEDVTLETRVIAAIMPNAEGIGEQPWTCRRATVAEVESRSGYRLLGRVPESVRTAIEVRLGSRRDQRTPASRHLLKRTLTGAAEATACRPNATCPLKANIVFVEGNEVYVSAATAMSDAGRPPCCASATIRIAATPAHARGSRSTVMSPLPVLDLVMGRVEGVAHSDVDILVRVLVLRLPVDRNDAAGQREVNPRMEHPSPWGVFVAKLHDDVARGQAIAGHLFELGRASANELVEIGRVLESTKRDLQRRFHGPTPGKAHAIAEPSLHRC